MSIRFTAAALLGVAVLTGGLVGCVASQPSPELSPVTTSFEGPWARELQDAFNKSTDPFVRAVLADGKITEQEHVETIDKYISCMADGGVTMHPDTSYDIPPAMGSQRAHEVEERCSDESGANPIDAYYDLMNRNPDNLDDSEIIVACAIEKGGLPEGYTAEEFDRDDPSQNYPYVDKVTGPLIVDECYKDPLGLIG